MLGSQAVTAMAVDSQDNVVLAGQFGPSLQLGSPLMAYGTADVFLAKVPQNLTPITWANHYGDFGGTGKSAPSWIATDGADAILVTGTTAGSGDLGNGTMPAMGDGFIAKYDGKDAYKWAMRFNGAPGPGGVASDTHSNVVLAGNVGPPSGGPLSFGGASLPPIGSMSNVYLAKLDPSGKQLWAEVFGTTDGTYHEGPAVVTTDPSTEDVIMAFHNRGTLTIGQDTIPTADPQAGTLILARFHP
jgi:hypothetical protein